MIVRIAQLRDIDAVVSIEVSAHVEDRLDAYLYPARNRHPKAFRKLLYRHFKHINMDPLSFVTTAQTEPTDTCWTGSPEIVGYCCWWRATKDDQVKQRYVGNESQLQRVVREIQTSDFLDDIVMLLNPAASLVQQRRYDAACNHDERVDPGYKEPDEMWYVTDIAVDPEFQRQGVGMQLLEWGIERARGDGVPVVLASTTAGRRLYDKAGFLQYGMLQWSPSPKDCFALLRLETHELEISKSPTT